MLVSFPRPFTFVPVFRRLSNSGEIDATHRANLAPFRLDDAYATEGNNPNLAF
jgi:hypothetical protein